MGAQCFSDLRVGVYKEIVPMGVDPDALSYRLTGTHLEPEEFPKEVKALLSKGDFCNDTILPNSYELDLTAYVHCVLCFPDYVDQNLDLFRDKKDVRKDVYQLKGGIQKYVEQFPEGFYRGKLFVFDECYAISNSDIISEYRYCGSPWDQYQLCSTHFCCQLVLSCSACRQGGPHRLLPHLPDQGPGRRALHHTYTERGVRVHRRVAQDPPGCIVVYENIKQR